MKRQKSQQWQVGCTYMYAPGLRQLCKASRLRVIKLMSNACELFHSMFYNCHVYLQSCGSFLGFSPKLRGDFRLHAKVFGAVNAIVGVFLATWDSCFVAMSMSNVTTNQALFKGRINSKGKAKQLDFSFNGNCQGTCHLNFGLCADTDDLGPISRMWVCERL